MRSATVTDMENCSLVVMSFANDRAVVGVLEPSAGVIVYCRSAFDLGVCAAVASQNQIRIVNISQGFIRFKIENVCLFDEPQHIR